MANRQTRELEALLRTAADREAGDVFLIPGMPPRLRVKGDILEGEGAPLTREEVHAIAAAAVGAEHIERIGREVGEVVTWCGLPGLINGTLCVARAQGDLTIVIRVHPCTVLDVDAIELPRSVLHAADSRSGILVFAGPPGSGKATTVYSVLDHINATKPWHICTVTCPTPMRIAPKRGIVQHREIGVDVPDCISGIRAAMNQDPDLLYVSEVRRPDELEACLSAAESGHLVFMQVHASNFETALRRLLNAAAPGAARSVCRTRLAEMLRAVCVQVLLPRDGNRGRVCAYGVLVPDDRIRRAIIEEGPLIDKSRPLPDACQTLAEDLLRLCKEGHISKETAEKALELA